MKKAIIAAFILVFTAALLTACGGGKPSNGTYKSNEGLLSQTWTLSGSNDITMSSGGGLISTKGTYTIDGSSMRITMSVLGMESTSSYTITEIKSKSFIINGTKFVKQ